MTSSSAKRVLPRAMYVSLLLLCTLGVKNAQAMPDDSEKKGLRNRLVSVPRKVTGGVGALISPATSGVAFVGQKVQGGFGVAKAGIRAVKARGAQCVGFLTSTASKIPALTHSTEPWDLGTDIEAQVNSVWSGDRSFEASLRDHLRLIFEARLENVGSKINFETVAEAEAYRQTIGRFWTPQPVDYSDLLHDAIDPRIIPESVHAIELFRLTRELALDFYERYDVIRAYIGDVVRLDSWVPLPGHISVRLTRLVTGPILDYRNENARIGALWEVARLLPADVRERLLVAVEHHIRNQSVPNSERARFRRFVHSGEFERVAQLVEKLQAEGLLDAGSVGAEQLIVRSNEIDSDEAQELRDDLRRKLKVAHPDHAKVVAVIGSDGLRSLSRVFTQDEYLELDNGSEPTAQPEIRDKQLAKLVARYQWTRIKGEERDDIERALASLKNAHLDKDAFIEKLSDVHDNGFRRVVMKSVLPDFLTKRAPREIPQ